MIGPRAALIYSMVLVSAADNDMRDSELKKMGELIRYLPVFKNFEANRIVEIGTQCAELLADPDGLEKALSMIAEALPQHLRQTAYALACEVAAADGMLPDAEVRFLDMLRHKLEISRLEAVAIERGIWVRYKSLEV